MKKVFCLILAGTITVSMLSFPAFAAEEDVVYGTMQIPYEAFYANEGIAGEVDAVSSATDSKWQNQDLVGGTYNEPHTEDAGGDILGVVYPVSISAADLEVLGDNNYGFTAMDSEPAAYKNVTVENGEAVFSAVNGETTELEAEYTFTTVTGYGDYEIDVKSINNSEGTSDIGIIAGVKLTTTDGSVYGLRHLENIWRDNLAWSCGITTNEKHGNELKSAQYEDMMGKTIDSITYITDSGYHVLLADIYVPVKFVGGVEAADAEAAAGQTAVTFTALPEDYVPAYSVAGLDITVEDGIMAWEAAYAGAYSLEVTDDTDVYAPLYADFTLSTDEVPVVYDSASQSLVAAEGFDSDAAAAFIKNIQKVAVNGEEYNAQGKGAAMIIDSEGWVDSGAVLVKGKGPDAEQASIFPESGDYEVIVTAAGYSTPVTFTFTVE